jgi:hypothetical protein
VKKALAMAGAMVEWRDEWLAA